MDLADLRAFVAASRGGTIAEAATALQLTSAPVSRAISRLEREIGGPLFIRQYHHLELTDLGRIALPHAVEALAHVRAIQLSPTAPSPTLRISASPWAPPHLSADLTRIAQASGPTQAQPASTSAHLAAALTHGDLDVALIHVPIDRTGLTTRPLARYHFSLFCPTDHRFAQNPVSLADLMGIPLAIPVGLHRRLALAGVLQEFAALGIGPIVDLHLQDWSQLAAQVRAAEAITVGTRETDTPMVHRMTRPGLAPIDLRQELPTLDIALAWRTLDSVNAQRLDDIDRQLSPGTVLQLR